MRLLSFTDVLAAVVEICFQLKENIPVLSLYFFLLCWLCQKVCTIDLFQTFTIAELTFKAVSIELNFAIQRVLITSIAETLPLINENGTALYIFLCL